MTETNDPLDDMKQDIDNLVVENSLHSLSVRIDNLLVEQAWNEQQLHLQLDLINSLSMRIDELENKTKSEGK